MTFADAFPLLDSIGGFYEPDELEALWDAAAAVPECGRIVEIGCEKGRSTACMLLATEGRCVQVTVVDCFVDHPDAGIEAEFMRTWRRIGAPRRLHLLCRDSRSLSVKDLGDQPINLMHIDGDHHLETVQYELILATRFDVPVVAIHDYGRPTLPDVTKAVDRWLAWNHRQSTLTNTLLVVR